MLQEIQEIQEIQERPCGATEKALYKSGVSREKPSLQTSKLPNFQSVFAVSFFPGLLHSGEAIKKPRDREVSGRGLRWIERRGWKCLRGGGGG